MDTQYYCKNKVRRQDVKGHDSLNGIDYLEVLDTEGPVENLRQRTLLVRFLNRLPLTNTLNAGNILIEGGVRITPIKVLWANPAPTVPGDLITKEEQNFLSSLPMPGHWLVVRTDRRGDFSTYRLRLVNPKYLEQPPEGYDLRLSEVEFSFKVECAGDFDCRPVQECPPEPKEPEPPIDYLAKDYASFRQLMLDRLSVVLPEWQERNPADTGMALVEVLAYAADHLSYHQDAVATEAYLGTARKRVSVRRHARLLDYPMHDGSNARTWVQVQVNAESILLEEGTPLLTRLTGQAPHIAPDSPRYAQAMAQQPEVFETMHNVVLCRSHNKIPFYTWGDEECRLPKGATRATLKNTGGKMNEENLKPGDVLIFEEVKGPGTGHADPTNRHAVRLAVVEFTEDRLFKENEDEDQPQRIVNIEWYEQDALPFPLCVSSVNNQGPVEDISVARGNIVLVDHGYKLEKEEEIKLPINGRFRPRLKEAQITHCVPFDSDDARSRPAFEATQQEPRAALPVVLLQEKDDRQGGTWEPRHDLLNSDRFAREFVVEMEEDRRATLRFGDDVHGKRPAAETTFSASYRIGNGKAGNVGADAIAHVVTDREEIVGVRNPIPAQGGTDPEHVERVRLDAPQAFRTQERAVTGADYAAMAERHPEVQKAVASRRWTGSWHTVFVTVDRKGGQPVDAEFEQELRGFLERFRLAGHDLEIEPPRFVPLDIAVRVCVAPCYYRSMVKEALLETFSNQDLPGGRRGFFHPDRLTFGQPVYLGRVVAAAMEIPGVQHVEVVRFERSGQEPLDEFKEGRIPMARLEIARLDNDPNAPENGKIEFIMEGGL